MQRLLQYIGGEFVEPASGQWIDDIEPASGDVIAAIARGNADDVDRAVTAASASTWSSTTVHERADWLDAIADRIEAGLEDLARMESRDTGKPISLARGVDIPRAVSNFRFFAGLVRHHQDPSAMMADAINYTVRHPVGNVALITPWNLPIYLLSWKVAPALAMGNCVIAKPSELTPLTADALARLIHELGLPAGTFNLLHGYGAEVGAPLTAHEGIGAISFTGGTATGRQVAAAAEFRKLSLELGGKNATVVFDDCDLDQAIDGTLRAAFANQGQICLCGSRLLVQRGIYEQFRERFVAATKAMKVGDPAAADTRIGALISDAHREKVEGYLELARQEGGTILCGGERPDRAGFFLTPAVVDDLSINARCATEEIFGPVCTLHPFDSEEQAITMANATRYGLSASVWTRDLGRAHRVSRRLECGMVWVNTWLHRDLRVPFGGIKDSGVGREGGKWSLEFFSEAQNICVRVDEES
ncbi:2-hydroxymuconic semialdehyde dehydrogenase [bacterium]|nr:MAG: 2-hydroxymuconic semialdehyde dehydrogenase [bacterium]